ncbi:chemotaxis protein CheX [Candidatus Magnetomoraceae bacterium gMMP-15]
MDAKVVNPFIKATLNVLETMAFTKAKTQKPFLKKDNTATGDVSAVIGLSGSGKGTVSVSFTESCILSIVSNMFGEEIKELNEEVMDAAGEISNMISGQARQELESIGKVFYAAVPSVIVGKNHTITHLTSAPIMAIPFATETGTFTIEVCFEE